jgi:polar amino acid transport system substrate-binding protein
MPSLGKLLTILSFGFFCSSLNSAHADTFKASLPDIMLDTTEKPSEFLGLVFLWGEILSNDINVEYYPFKRSILNIISKQADFHFPLIKNPNKSNSELGFDYSTSVITQVNFVLYTRKDRPIDIDNLSAYKIATDAAHTDLFNFPVEGIFSVDGALKKLNSGRIDGYIFSGEVADVVLKQLHLTNIHRQLYRTYDVHAILPLGGQGNKTDQMITEAQAAIAASPEYNHVINNIYVPYIEWQLK